MKKRLSLGLDIRNWSTLALGETVEIRRHGVIEAQGRIEDIAHDGAFLCDPQEGARGRRLLRSADNVRVFRVRPDKEPSWR